MVNTNILIGADELAGHLDDPAWVIVDCRFDLADASAGRRAFDEAHIPGAVFLDLDRDLAGPVTPTSGRHPLPDPGDLAGKLGRLGIGAASQVVVHDAGSGAYAARAWWILRWLGHERVRLLDGGYAAWQAAGLPVTAAGSRPVATHFTPHPRDEVILTTAEIAADPAMIPGLRLVDARDAARFRGELEPIDPVAGHVPGALNLPFADLLAADGRWRPVPERRERLAQVLGPDADVPWAVMCGSGVTACVLAIAGLEAGYREPRLYVGSWSEWIRDPGRPRAGKRG